MPRSLEYQLIILIFSWSWQILNLLQAGEAIFILHCLITREHFCHNLVLVSLKKNKQKRREKDKILNFFNFFSLFWMNTLIPTNLTVGDRPVNVYEWETKDVVGWLRENDLFDYTAIFGENKNDYKKSDDCVKK